MPKPRESFRIPSEELKPALKADAVKAKNMVLEYLVRN